MAYSSGDLILDDHYNGFATDVNTVWGTGSGLAGYGQSNTVGSVSAGTVVSATQWATLLSRITSAASHQGSSITSISGPSAGNTISAYTALSGNITTIGNNKNNANANGSDITSGGAASYTSEWWGSSSATFTITFSSANAARYFFNAGGMFRVTSSRSGGSSNNKNTEWTDLCGDVGTMCFTSGAAATIAGTSYNAGITKIGGGGSTPALTQIGYTGLTSAYQQTFTQYADTAPYTANFIKVEVKDNNSNVVTVVVTYVDAAADTFVDNVGLPLDHDKVDGTLATTLVVRPPSTANISNTWGTPTISNSATGTNAY